MYITICNNWINFCWAINEVDPMRDMVISKYTVPLHHYCIKEVLNPSLCFKMRNKPYKEMGTGNTLYTSNYFFSTFVILLSFIGGGANY